MNEVMLGVYVKLFLYDILWFCYNFGQHRMIYPVFLSVLAIIFMSYQQLFMFKFCFF